MSVLPCARKDCDNVMCQRYSPEFGYICDECFEELVACGPGVDIRLFMNSPTRREQDSQRLKQAWDRFNQEFLLEGRQVK